MKYIFYKTGDKIASHYPAPKSIPEEELPGRIELYNAENGPKGKTAFVLEPQEGSVEAYLLECLDKKYRFARDALQEAKDAVWQIRDCLECLKFVED